MFEVTIDGVFVKLPVITPYYINWNKDLSGKIIMIETRQSSKILLKYYGFSTLERKRYVVFKESSYKLYFYVLLGLTSFFMIILMFKKLNKRKKIDKSNTIVLQNVSVQETLL